VAKVFLCLKPLLFLVKNFSLPTFAKAIAVPPEKLYTPYTPNKHQPCWTAHTARACLTAARPDQPLLNSC